MRAPSKGFTLLEILVAVAIFAVVMVLAYGGLNAIIRVQTAVGSEQGQLQQLEFAINRFERDLRHVLARTARAEYGATEPAVLGDRTNLVFSTTIVSASESGPQRRAVRVRHEFSSERWLRRQFGALDIAPATTQRSNLLFTDFSSASLAYMDYNLVLGDRWPPQGADSDTLSPDTLPRAIELRLQTRQWGEIRRLILLREQPEPPGLPDGVDSQ